MDLVNMFSRFREKLLGYRLIMLILSVVLGLILTLLFSGKPYLSLELEAIAVSPDEQYIACFEPSKEDRIYCFHADGSLGFEYTIPSEISAGGYCSLWFEDGILCALFYRTDKILSFALNGTILKISNGPHVDSLPKFPSFSIVGHKYVFDGNNIDVVYDKKSWGEYFCFNSERYLEITTSSGINNVVLSWTATEGMKRHEKTD